MSLDIERISR